MIHPSLSIIDHYTLPSFNIIPGSTGSWKPETVDRPSPPPVRRTNGLRTENLWLTCPAENSWAIRIFNEYWVINSSIQCVNSEVAHIEIINFERYKNPICTIRSLSWWLLSVPAPHARLDNDVSQPSGLWVTSPTEICPDHPSQLFGASLIP